MHTVSQGKVQTGKEQSSTSPDLVRQEYKRYKRKKPPPDFSEVIDFNRVWQFKDKVEIVPSCRDCLNVCTAGMIPTSQWEVYKVKACDGFLFIKNPFTHIGQKYWTYKALTEYTRKPYPCNLDVHMKLDESKTIWEISQIKNPSNPYTFMEKLRWTHIGYHFDYNYVNYKEEKYYGFPDDLTHLMKCIATGLGFDNYSPETAIINYYPIGSSMGGHTDHYEEELDAPLISVSFGQPAVFLIGGKTKDIQPEAIWIHSGDIVIMSGPSRVAYHAVPCIVKEGEDGAPPQELRYSPCITSDIEEEAGTESINKMNNGDTVPEGREQFHECYCTLKPEEHFCKGMKIMPDGWKVFEDYFSRTRVNINVRQVHKS